MLEVIREIQIEVGSITVGKSRGFTLIELLVVIAIIALLMAILMPALNRVKKQAKAVACQAQLKQWSLCFSMYADEYDGDLGCPAGKGNLLWVDMLRSYYKEPKIRCCPTATKPANPLGGEEHPAGGKFLAWGFFPSGDKGSYGINAWVYNPPAGMDSYMGHSVEGMWRSINVKGAADIPLLLDSSWIGGCPEHYDRSPEYDDEQDISSEASSMLRFCINRHDGYINGLFLDFSVGEIGLKELWKLKWRREYDTSGAWTTQGGVRPDNWPIWMRSFKDY